MVFIRVNAESMLWIVFERVHLASKNWQSRDADNWLGLGVEHSPSGCHGNAGLR